MELKNINARPIPIPNWGKAPNDSTLTV
jgi:hypothetical protein